MSNTTYQDLNVPIHKVCQGLHHLLSLLSLFEVGVASSICFLQNDKNMKRFIDSLPLIIDLIGKYRLFGSPLICFGLASEWLFKSVIHRTVSCLSQVLYRVDSLNPYWQSADTSM